MDYFQDFVKLRDSNWCVFVFQTQYSKTSLYFLYSRGLCLVATNWPRIKQLNKVRLFFAAFGCLVLKSFYKNKGFWRAE